MTHPVLSVLTLFALCLTWPDLARGQDGEPRRVVCCGGGQTEPDLTIWQYWWGFNEGTRVEVEARLRQSASHDAAGSRERIVSALIDALEGAGLLEQELVCSCLLALAEIGGSARGAAAMTARIGHPSQGIRESALLALGIQGNPADVAALEASLAQRTNDRTAAFAAYALGLLGARSEDPRLRARVVRALAEATRARRGPGSDVPVAAVISLGLVPLEPGPDRAGLVELLIGLVEDERFDPLARAHAPCAAAKQVRSTPGGLRARLARVSLAQLGAGAPELRQGCALALGLIGRLGLGPLDVEIRHGLFDAGQDPDPQTRRFLLIALGKVGRRVGGDEAPLAGRLAIEAELERALAHGDPDLQAWAGLAIGEMQRGLLESSRTASPSALVALRGMLTPKQPVWTMSPCALASGRIGDRAAEQSLMQRLATTREDAPRGDVAIALGLMGAQDARASLHELVACSKYRGDLLRDAALALGMLGDESAVPRLLDMLEHEAKTLSTRAAITRALGAIGERRAVAPLIALLGDRSLGVRSRAFAARALGAIACSRSSPWQAELSADLNYRATTPTLVTFGADDSGVLDL